MRTSIWGLTAGQRVLRAKDVLMFSFNETVRLGRVKNSGGYLKHEESLEHIRFANRPTVSEKKTPPLT